ncbi:MAG: D-tyrosyl-tRNA(Tyr) deacylase [Tissierellia bacterium]|nr:D-tyrosyl-tRNA(Tyr) deacylase [Tissierellia bacterium]
MRAVIQRVSKASVTVDNKTVGEIEKGLLVLLGVGKEDTISDLDYLVNKIIGLRIFEDDNEKMNLSLTDIGGNLLVVSQFTLFGDVRKGKRPSFTDSAPPDIAEEMYLKFIDKCIEMGIKTEKGIFGADMKVSLVNDGPVTILLDSKKIF